nr:hypothetical protein [Leucobacter massiliensis]
MGLAVLALQLVPELDRLLALGARPTDIGQGPKATEYCLLRRRLC